MIDRNLKYEDSIGKVRAGEHYVHTHLEIAQLLRISEAVELLDQLVRTSSLAGNTLFERLAPSWMARIPLKPEQVTYARAEWAPTAEMSKNYFWHEFYSRLIASSQTPVETSLWGKFPFEMREEVLGTLDEMIKNLAEHGQRAHDPWEVDLHASKSGVVLSTYQMGEFDLVAELDRRLQLPPDRTPRGNSIVRPRYWNDFGNGDGFIRGNGLAEIADSPLVQVNFRFEEEPQGRATRQFAFSDQHLK